MKFSENWLRTMVNPALSSDGLQHLLTMAGLEVEDVAPVAPAFARVVVAEVLSVEKHPDAERLTVCKLVLGAGGPPLNVVCGAANVHAGAKVPLALPGASLPGKSVSQSSVRGVESCGMLCSEKELGLSDDGSGVMLLAPDAPLGQDLRAYLELDDEVFALKLTPNRGDCLSVAGIAREVAALTGAKLSLIDAEACKSTVSDRVAVTVKDAAACPRYCGRALRGVNVRARTPQWMAQRLTRGGVRPISSIVDICNYVMLESGQPLHAFDLAKLEGGINARFARKGESLKLLNGETVPLSAEFLVIADDARPLALAGIMGGEESAVTDATTDIFLESAFFDPKVIAGKSRLLGFSTESSHRFERGVDYAATARFLERATRLVQEICGGKPGPVTKVSGKLPARKAIALRTARAASLLGVPLQARVAKAMLTRLGMNVRAKDKYLLATPPSYRFDLAIEEDLVEEIARLHGYENVPATSPRSSPAMAARPEEARAMDSVRALLVARDYQEVISYSFVDEAWERDFTGNRHPVRLKNPIAANLGVMRSSLIASLVACLAFNLNRKREQVRIFESGRCFESLADGYSQPEKIAGLAFGLAHPEQWGVEKRALDFYDVKADVEALFHPLVLEFQAQAHPALHPGRSAKVISGGDVLGIVGELHPQWCQKYELPQAPVVFELSVSALVKRNLPRYQEISKFPPVRRDLAIIVDGQVAVGAILTALWNGRPQIVAEITLFDLYRGKGVPEGKKSLAFRVLLQHTSKTLTDGEVDGAVAELVDLLKSKYNAQLRT